MVRMNNDPLSNSAQKKVEEFDFKDSKIYAAKRLAKFFEVEVTLKILGVVVFHRQFPPSNQ